MSRLPNRPQRVGFEPVPADGTLDLSIEELCRLRTDINRIGTNINQIIFEFHQTDAPGARVAAALRIESKYKEVGKVVEQLLDMISEFTKSCRHRDFLRDGYRLGEFKILKVADHSGGD